MLKNKILYPWAELFDSGIKTIPIFAYGSLVDPKSAASSFQFTKVNMKYVIATGVRRVFNYLMPDRHLERWGVELFGNQKAALNLEITNEPEDRVNGVLIEIDTRDFQSLLKREEGYDLLQVNATEWPEGQSNASEHPYAFIAAPDSQYVDHAIDPVPGYFDLCVQAARNVSPSFSEYFDRTTFLNSGQSIQSIR